MREIEFRIRYGDKTWYYGLPITKIKNGTVGFKSFDNSYYDLFADATTLGQYTGRCDKNGTKIFEYDVLCKTICNEFTKNKEIKFYSYVKYNDGMFATFYKDYEDGELIEFETDRVCEALIEYDKLEVVGNIYDNPELLGEIYDN